jgi:hypothetical protein
MSTTRFERIGYRTAAELLDALMDGAPEPVTDSFGPGIHGHAKSGDAFVVEVLAMVAAAYSSFLTTCMRDIDVEQVAVASRPRAELCRAPSTTTRDDSHP